VFEIKGYHYYNEDPLTWGGTHVRNTLLKNLREMVIELPTGPGKPPEKFSMEELGIGFPILAVESRIEQDFKIRNPFYEGPEGTPGGMPSSGMMGALTGPGLAPIAPEGPAGAEGTAKKKPVDEASNPRFLPAPRYRFVVQFCWRETQLSERLEKRRQQTQPATAPGNTVAVTPTGG
jgi:hypothetical protein